MDQFIEELKGEHKEIIEFFNSIDESEKFEDKKEMIQKLTALVVTHLRKEDDRLYPVLAASSIQEIAKLGTVFSMAMKDTSEKYVAFVEAFLKSDKMTEELTDAYNRINKTIKNRVTIEEIVLYPAYEKCL